MTTDETGAYVAITRLQAAYADVVTRRAWAELVPLFVPDAPIHLDTVSRPVLELVGPEALGTFVADAIERFEFFQFVVLNTVIEVEGDGSARGRLTMVELRQEATTGAWTNAFGVYQDEYREVGGRWRFAARRYQSLARTAPGVRAEVFPFPPVPGSG